MGRFTDRCIESLLGELQMYAERANQAMSLIIDNFQLSYNEQEDTVDLTRIKHPDWYGNDFEGVCRVTLESYEGIIDDDTDKQYEYYLDLVESYFSEFEDEKRYTLLRKLMQSSSFFLWHQSLVLHDFISDYRDQDCEIMEALEGSYANSILCIIDDFYSFIREVIDLCKIYKIDAYNIAVELYPTLKDIELSLFDKDYIVQEDETKELIKKNGVTIKQKTSAIISLIRAAGFTSYDNTKMADFISWLTDGNSEYIRQKCITADINKKDAAILKKEFSMIGINYDVETHKIVKE